MMKWSMAIPVISVSQAAGDFGGRESLQDQIPDKPQAIISERQNKL